MAETDSTPQPTSQSPLRRTQPLVLFREDSMVDPVTKTLEWDPTNPSGVVDVVKEFGTASFGFAGSATLRLFAGSKAQAGQERVPIANDEQLRDILMASPENEQLEVFVGVEAPTIPQKRLRVKAECHPDSTTFEFPFAFGDANVKAQLFSRAVEALQAVNPSYATPPEADEVEVIIDGEKTKIRSDKVLLELLHARLENDSADPLVIVLPGGLDTNGRSMSKIVVAVEATYRASLTTTTAAFHFSYRGEEGNLLETFRQECRGELELPAGAKLAISATLPEGVVAITGDSQLLALLSGTPSGEVLHVEVADDQTASATLSVQVKCAVDAPESEACEFSFRARLDEPNLLGSLRAGVVNVLDLDDDDVTLLYVDAETKEAVVVSSDRQLRDIVAHHHEVNAAIEVRAQAKTRAPSSPDPVKTFLITHGDSHATFTNYKCPKGPRELLQALLHDIRWEFELLRQTGESEHAHSLTLEVKLASGTITVTEDDPDNAFVGVAEAPDTEVSITVLSDKAPASAIKHTHWLRANVHAKVGEAKEYANLVFRCSVGQPEVLREFVKELASELELEMDDEATITVFDGSVDPPVLIDKDEALLALATTEQFHHPHRFVAEIDLPFRAPASPHARSASRMAELNALVSEWKDALDGLWRPSNVEQMAATFLMEGTPLPSDDALMVHLREALKEDQPRSVGDLHDTILEWTSHLSEEVFSAFCHHCREVLDFVVDFSPLSRLKRAIGVAFRQMSVNLLVGKPELAQVLRDSKAVAPEDIDECLAAYGDSLTAEQFTEALNWLFRDVPQDIVDVITVLQQDANRSPTRSRREVELLRRKRLQSEIRHAFDSVSLFHMKDFAAANQATDEQDWLNLALAVTLLLSEEVARTKEDPAQASWKWLVSQIDEEKKALSFVAHLGQTQRSYASLHDISEAVTYLLAPGAEAGALFPASKLLSALSLWGLRLAQLTCHAQRWTWPPPGAFTHSSPPPSHHLGSPIKVEPPKEERSAAVVSSRPRRYEFKHRAISTEYAAMELEPLTIAAPGKTLKELMEEQRQQRADGATTPAAENGGPHNAEPEEHPSEKPAADNPSGAQDGEGTKDQSNSSDDRRQSTTQEQNDRRQSQTQEQNDRRQSQTQEQNDRRQSQTQEQNDPRQSQTQEQNDRRQSQTQEQTERRQSTTQQQTERRQSTTQEQNERRQSQTQEQNDRRQSQTQEQNDRRQSQTQEQTERRQSTTQEQTERRQSHTQEQNDRRQSQTQEQTERRQSHTQEQTERRQSAAQEQPGAQDGAANNAPSQGEEPASQNPQPNGQSQEQEAAAVQLQLAGRQKLARDEVDERKRSRSQPPAE